MGMIKRLKKALICRSLAKHRQENPFDEESAERFTLPSDADDTQNNSYYFSCHDMQGNSLFFRHARRGSGKTEVWFAFKNAAGDAYINEQQLYTQDAPTSVACIKPGQAWDFAFHGSVRNLKTSQIFPVKFSGTFTATGRIFEFGHDVDAGVMAEAIANEKWSTSFFRDLQQNDQVHYEQPGHVSGTLILNGQSSEWSLPAMRDHSFGKRDWNYMNRHFWLMALLADGRSFNANMVSYPIFKLQTGYLDEGGKFTAAKAARIIGDVQRPHTVPSAFTYEAQLTDGRTLRAACRLEEVFVFPFGNGAYTIYEGVGSFDADGVKGRGIIEFGWNGDVSRCV